MESYICCLLHICVLNGFFNISFISIFQTKICDSLKCRLLKILPRVLSVEKKILKRIILPCILTFQMCFFL